MKSMRGEIVVNIPARKAWDMYRNNEIISKINPNMLAGAQYLNGDGSPGSLRLLKLGPGILFVIEVVSMLKLSCIVRRLCMPHICVEYYVKESTEIIERVEVGKSVTYRVIAGELKNMYDPYIVTFSFTPLPGKELEKCTVEWKAEFEPLAPTTPPPEKAKDAALGFIKSFEKYQLCQ